VRNMADYPRMERGDQPLFLWLQSSSQYRFRCVHQYQWIMVDFVFPVRQPLDGGQTRNKEMLIVRSDRLIMVIVPWRDRAPILGGNVVARVLFNRATISAPIVGKAIGF
jgi:hypothetical protein